ncbi:MAG: amidohydrolase family protein [Dehalococcoidia bacterium]
MVTPAFVPPARACDAHLHAFGSRSEYPLIANLRDEPPIATVEQCMELGASLGLERIVFVQPSGYGTDNRCQLDAAAAMGLDRARVVVALEDDVSEAELEPLSDRGVCGIRINVSPVEPYRPELIPDVAEQVRLMESHCRRLGWHLDFLFPDWLTSAFMPEFRKLQVPYTIAHLGMNRADAGVEAQGFQDLLELMSSGDRNCWVKFTASYRISQDAGYQDVVPMAQAAVQSASDRVLWGTDYPHLGFVGEDSVVHFNLLKDAAPDEADRTRILVTNPEELYGF